MRLKERYDGVLGWFAAHVGKAETELHFSSNFELLVAVMLSAQCTDKRVNQTTPALFAAYPDAASMAAAKEEEIFSLIRSISYPNSKARHLHEMAVRLSGEFGGEVPCDMDLLQTLPGVGRKTANVVMAVAFDKPAMPVDTHVFRVTARIGLVRNAKTPFETERQLVSHIPAELLSTAHHWFILHGRYTCMARKPKCGGCGIREFCAYFQKNGGVDAAGE